MRKIAVVTGTRAEYGLLYWIIRGIHEDRNLELQLIVTGTHLSAEFGYTLSEIEEDGFPVAERVDMLLSSDSETAVATSMGLAVIGFAKAYERLRPDILVVLGDRCEILAAVSAALPFRIPIAHIHGGESTEGLIDESIRHAVTKMSHLHFPAALPYMKKIMQMGESPENIFHFGAPGLDNIYKLRLMSRSELAGELKIPVEGLVGTVTFHPVTLEKNRAEQQVETLLQAIDSFPHVCWVFTLPNADTESRSIARKLKTFVSHHPQNTRLFASLGRKMYLSLLKNCSIIVGNSSSALIEAPSFELPAVNIGDRQRGRIRAKNVIDVAECTKVVVEDAIRRALSPEFRESLKGMTNPYGKGKASREIVRKLKTVKLGPKFLKKTFFEIPQ